MDTKSLSPYESPAPGRHGVAARTRRVAASSIAVMASTALVLGGANVAMAHPTSMPEHPADSALASVIDNAHHDAHRLVKAEAAKESAANAAQAAHKNDRVDAIHGHAKESVGTVVTPVYNSLTSTYDSVSQANADATTRIVSVANRVREHSEAHHNPIGASIADTVTQRTAAASNDFAGAQLAVHNAASAAVDNAVSVANQTIDGVADSAHASINNRTAQKQASIDAQAALANEVIHHVSDAAQVAGNQLATAVGTAQNAAQATEGVAQLARQAVVSTVNQFDQVLINAGTQLGAPSVAHQGPTAQ
ncbi:hypothetical protein [Corynebacterium kroppenstedtii]